MPDRGDHDAAISAFTLAGIRSHRDPKITSEVYGHLDLEDMREGLNRLHLAPLVTERGPFAASLLLGPADPEKEGPDASRNPEQRRGLQMVGATGFEPATTCTPTMTGGESPILTGRTESQGLGITEPEDRALAPPDAPAAPLIMGNGAHMGRGNFPVSEHTANAVQDLGRRIAEAVAAGKFELARTLTEEAIRVRAGEPHPVDGRGGDFSE